MSENKVKKTVQFNKSNQDDQLCLKKISTLNVSFNSYVRNLILEDIKREKMKSMQSGKGGIKITLG